MKNSTNNFLIPDLENQFSKKTTTLIIDEVPSEVAYGVVQQMLSMGKNFSQEELKAEIYGGEKKIQIEYDNFVDYILEIEKSRLDDNINYEEPLQKRNTTVSEHRPGQWKINPDNPEEEILECLDCGYIMDRRSTKLGNYAGKSNMNEELFKMLNEQDKDSSIFENDNMSSLGKTSFEEDINVGYPEQNQKSFRL